jgi:hypothetical protein
MMLWKIAALAALAAWSSACAPAADTRALTPAEKEQLVRDHRTLELRHRLGAASPQRLGCSASSPVSRLNARQSHYSGADSFDTRACTDEQVGKTRPPPAAGE